MSALKPSLLRMFTAHDTAWGQVGWWCGDGETQEGEQFGHEVQRARRYRIYSSRVNPHATHMDALA